VPAAEGLLRSIFKALIKQSPTFSDHIVTVLPEAPFLTAKTPRTLAEGPD